MAMTPDQARAQEDEFSAAFATDPMKKPEKTEDEEFGLQPEQEVESAPVSEGKEGESPAVEAAEGGADGGADGAAPAMAIVIEPGAEEGGDVEPTDPKDVQRAKTWEGRLRAREAELKAREEALAAKEKAPEESPAEQATETPADEAKEEVAEKAEGETPAEEAAEGPAAEKIEEVATQVDNGEITAEKAMQILSQDFGEDFTKMLSVLIESRASEIAGKAADERVGKVDGKLDGLIGELVDDKARSHFEALSDAHPDFMEIGESPEFKAYVEAMPEDEKAAAIDIISHGTARQIAKLLSTYKSSKEQDKPEEPDQSKLDDAEGVRSASAGLKLPDQPAMADDYESAWEKF